MQSKFIASELLADFFEGPVTTSNPPT